MREPYDALPAVHGGETLAAFLSCRKEAGSIVEAKTARVCRAKYWRGERFTERMPEICLRVPFEYSVECYQHMHMRKLPKVGEKPPLKLRVKCAQCSHRAGNSASFQQQEWKTSQLTGHHLDF